MSPLARRRGKLVTYPTRNFALNLTLNQQSYLERTACPCALTLHVAMQMGPSHDPVSWTFGVWPLRILISSVLGFLRFMVSVISAISTRPVGVKCRSSSIISCSVRTSQSRSLRRPKRVLLEEWNYRLYKIISTGSRCTGACAPDGCRIAHVAIDMPDPEELSELFKAGNGYWRPAITTNLDAT